MTDLDRSTIDRITSAHATAPDLIAFVKYELQQAMDSLPPNVKDGQSDGYHAGCCALRALSGILRLEDLLRKEANDAPVS